MRRFRDLPAAVFGRLGEQIVARRYQRDGWGILASFKFSGENDNEAPAIEIDDGEREITPDLDASKGGRRIWIEVKAYARAAQNDTLTRRAGHVVKVHGLPVRLMNNYRAVEARSGNPVYLAIVELDTRRILVSPSPITEMTPHSCLCGCGSLRPERCRIRQARGNQYPQWYWERDRFDEIGVVSEHEFRLLEIAHRRLPAPAPIERVPHALRRHDPARAEKPIQSAFSFDTPKRGGGLHGGDR